MKLGQIYFIQSDVDFYNEKMDSTVQCRALNITEDLGQIQYLFSDKTGTLTENKMVFRRCSVAGFDYCHEENGEYWVSVKTNPKIGHFWHPVKALIILAYGCYTSSKEALSFVCFQKLVDQSQGVYCRSFFKREENPSNSSRRWEMRY